MLKLLVPFDGSPFALRALRHALGQARSTGAELHVVHVHEPATDYGRTAAYQQATQIGRELDEASNLILQPAADEAKAAGVTFHTAILSGRPAEAIVSYAESHGCDGIVMGTHGAGAIGAMLLGSVCYKVIHLTKVAVTLIK